MSPTTFAYDDALRARIAETGFRRQHFGTERQALPARSDSLAQAAKALGVPQAIQSVRINAHAKYSDSGMSDYRQFGSLAPDP